MSPLFERAATVPLGGHPVPTLDATDQLAIVAIHGGRHLWERLAWICDVAEAARAPGSDVTAHTPSPGCGLRQGAAGCVPMAERVLGVAPAQTDALGAAAFDPAVDSICDSLLPLTLTPGGPARASAGTFARELARIMDHRTAALRGAVRAAVTPTASDWGVVKIPDALWPAYYPIRLARLFASYALGDRRPGDAEVASGTR